MKKLPATVLKNETNKENESVSLILWPWRAIVLMQFKYCLNAIQAYDVF